MRLHLADSIYGDFEIREPVFSDLLKCPALDRLSGIDQGGYMRVHFPGSEHTRLEHSIGVFLLLRLYGASLEEQVAGLLHDASHAVFSHAADYGLDEGSGARQDFQNRSHRGYILNSEVPEILELYGFEVERILDESNFTLLENELPDICADRIDYMLRSAVHAGSIEAREAKAMFTDLHVEQGRWIFSSPGPAREFAELFAFVNHTLLSGFPSAVMLRTVGDALRKAMLIGAVSRKDLFTRDDLVLSKMRDAAGQDLEMLELWRRMNLEGPVCPDFSSTPQAVAELKSRMVDPLCLDETGNVARLSYIQPDWDERVRSESIVKRYGMRFA